MATGKTILELDELTSVDAADVLPIVDSSTTPETTKRATVSNILSVNDTIAEGAIYGVRWDQANDNVVQGVVVNGAFVAVSPRNFPIQEDMVRGLYVAGNDAFSALNPNDSNELADGTAATLDGTAGDVVSRVPSHFQLWTKSGDYRYVLVSRSSFSFNGVAASIPLCFNGGSYYYIDAFEGVKYDDGDESLKQGTGNDDFVTGSDQLRSLPGYKPWTDQTRAECRSGYFNRGGNTHQELWSAHQMLVALALTEYGSWNSQDFLPGYTEADGWNHDYVRKTGRTLSLGNSSGSVIVDLANDDSDLEGHVAEDAAIANSYRGIENFFGHIRKWLDGININNTDGNCRVYVTSTIADLGDGDADNYVDTGHAPGFGDDDGYIQDILGQGQYCPLYPSDITGASTDTYLCDKHYNSSGGWRVLSVGGSLSGGAYAGFAALHANRASGHRDAGIGSRGAAYSDT